MMRVRKCLLPIFVGHYVNLSACNVCHCGPFMATVTGEAPVIYTMYGSLVSPYRVGNSTGFRFLIQGNAPHPHTITV